MTRYELRRAWRRRWHRRLGDRPRPQLPLDAAPVRRGALHLPGRRLRGCAPRRPATDLSDASCLRDGGGVGVGGADFCHPPLTTVTGPSEQAGRALIDLLPGNRSDSRVVLPTALRVREHVAVAHPHPDDRGGVGGARWRPCEPSNRGATASSGPTTSSGDAQPAHSDSESLAVTAADTRNGSHSIVTHQHDERPGRKLIKEPLTRPFGCGRYWDRTSDLFGVKQ
ncbi:MAG: Transcriptional regulator, LacI family [Pseudonocardia sp.]|nr:Transcriptional regulator, LacI family [Pseudonocardia sp.]